MALPPSFPLRDVWREWSAARAADPDHADAVLLTNCRVADVTSQTERYAAQGWVLCRRGVIESMGTGAPDAALPERGSPFFTEVDCGGRLLLPGLSDAHVHVTAASTADLAGLLSLSESLVTARALVQLEQMLMRGFTTVRDVVRAAVPSQLYPACIQPYPEAAAQGGADWGLAEAVEEGTSCGPRLLFVGHALSQTGGHGDLRTKGEDCFVCGPALRGLGRVCDGVDECRKAARDELRKGAHCIKIMASGGVASPTDKLTSTQFSMDEMRAIVEEATAVGTYVCAHAYTSASIQRALEAGVRCFEHGNLLDAETAAAIAGAGATLVPTLITYEKLVSDGAASGMPPELVAKVGDILEQGLDALRHANASGCEVAFGSDLLGAMQAAQCEEFDLRARVEPRWDTLRAATVRAAKLFQEPAGSAGVVAVGARADLIVVDSLEGLGSPEQNLKAVVKAGVLVVDRLRPTASATL